jgi:hypothetical protein
MERSEIRVRTFPHCAAPHAGYSPAFRSASQCQTARAEIANAMRPVNPGAGPPFISCPSLKARGSRAPTVAKQISLRAQRRGTRPPALHCGDFGLRPRFRESLSRPAFPGGPCSLVQRAPRRPVLVPVGRCLVPPGGRVRAEPAGAAVPAPPQDRLMSAPLTERECKPAYVLSICCQQERCLWIRALPVDARYPQPSSRPSAQREGRDP